MHFGTTKKGPKNSVKKVANLKRDLNAILEVLISIFRIFGVSQGISPGKKAKKELFGQKSDFWIFARVPLGKKIANFKRGFGGSSIDFSHFRVF